MFVFSAFLFFIGFPILGLIIFHKTKYSLAISDDFRWFLLMVFAGIPLIGLILIIIPLITAV